MEDPLFGSSVKFISTFKRVKKMNTGIGPSRRSTREKKSPGLKVLSDSDDGKSDSSESYRDDSDSGDESSSTKGDEGGSDERANNLLEAGNPAATTEAEMLTKREQPAIETFVSAQRKPDTAITYYSQFSTPKNLGVTCYFNQILASMYQLFRYDQYAWAPKTEVGVRIRDLLFLMSTPNAEVQMASRVLPILTALGISSKIQQDFDEAWRRVVANFNDVPNVEISSKRECIACRLKSHKQVVSDILLTLDIPAKAMQVNLQDLLQTCKTAGQWRCGSHECLLQDRHAACMGDCGGEPCVGNFSDCEAAQVETRIETAPASIYFTITIERREAKNYLPRAEVGCEPFVTLNGARYEVTMLVFHSSNYGTDPDSELSSIKGHDHGHYFGVIIDNNLLTLHNDNVQTPTDWEFVKARSKKLMGGCLVRVHQAVTNVTPTFDQAPLTVTTTLPPVKNAASTFCELGNASLQADQTALPDATGFATSPLDNNDASTFSERGNALLLADQTALPDATAFATSPLANNAAYTQLEPENASLQADQTALPDATGFPTLPLVNNTASTFLERENKKEEKKVRLFPAEVTFLCQLLPSMKFTIEQQDLVYFDNLCRQVENYLVLGPRAEIDTKTVTHGWTWSDLVRLYAPCKWRAWLTALADMWGVNFNIYHLTDEGVTEANVQAITPSAFTELETCRMLLFAGQWHPLISDSTVERISQFYIEEIPFECMAAGVGHQEMSFHPNKDVLSMLAACFFWDRHESNRNAKRLSRWPARLEENTKLFAYRSHPLGSGVKSVMNACILKPLALAGVNKEASKLVRVSDNSTMIESSAAMIAKVAAFIRTNRPWGEQDTHIVFGGGRRASFLLELCTRSGTTIVSIEKEQCAHEEANEIVLRYMDISSTNPKICNVLMNTNDLSAESIRGCTSASRFIGSVRAQRATGFDATDKMIFESPSMEVYWCCHVDMRGFAKLLKGGMNAKLTETWKLSTLPNLRQEAGRIQTYVWMREPQKPNSTSHQSDLILQWRESANASISTKLESRTAIRAVFAEQSRQPSSRAKHNRTPNLLETPIVLEETTFKTPKKNGKNKKTESAVKTAQKTPKPPKATLRETPKKTFASISANSSSATSTKNVEKKIIFEKAQKKAQQVAKSPASEKAQQVANPANARRTPTVSQRSVKTPIVSPTLSTSSHKSCSPSPKDLEMSNMIEKTQSMVAELKGMMAPSPTSSKLSNVKPGKYNIEKQPDLGSPLEKAVEKLVAAASKNDRDLLWVEQIKLNNEMQSFKDKIKKDELLRAEIKAEIWSKDKAKREAQQRSNDDAVLKETLRRDQQEKLIKEALQKSKEDAADRGRLQRSRSRHTSRKRSRSRGCSQEKTSQKRERSHERRKRSRSRSSSQRRQSRSCEKGPRSSSNNKRSFSQSQSSRNSESSSRRTWRSRSWEKKPRSSLNDRRSSSPNRSNRKSEISSGRRQRSRSVSQKRNRSRSEGRNDSYSRSGHQEEDPRSSSHKRERSPRKESAQQRDRSQ